MIQRLSAIFFSMASTYLDRVPVLSGERVHGLLLKALLALGESLVPIVSGWRLSFPKIRSIDTHFPTAMIPYQRTSSWESKGTKKLVEGLKKFNSCVHQPRSKRAKPERYRGKYFSANSVGGNFMLHRPQPSWPFLHA
jgi:hypothetical protein